MTTTVRRSSIGWGALVAAAVALAWAPGAAAPRPASPQPAAIAVVNLKRVIGELKEYEVLDRARIERAEALQQKLRALGSQLETLEAEINVLPPGSPELRDKRIQQRLLELDISTKQTIYQQVIDLERGDLLREIYRKIVIAAEQLAQRDGWDLILLDDRPLPTVPPSTDNEVAAVVFGQKKVLFAGERVDLTDELIAKMNNEFVP